MNLLILALFFLSIKPGKCCSELVSAWPSTPDPNPNAISNPRVVQNKSIHGSLIIHHNIFNILTAALNFSSRTRQISTKTSHCESCHKAKS